MLRDSCICVSFATCRSASRLDRCVFHVVLLQSLGGACVQIRLFLEDMVSMISQVSL